MSSTFSPTRLTNTAPTTSTTGQTTMKPACEEGSSNVFPQDDYLDTSLGNDSLFSGTMGSSSNLGTEQGGASSEMAALEAIVELVTVVAEALEEESVGTGSTSPGTSSMSSTSSSLPSTSSTNDLQPYSSSSNSLPTNAFAGETRSPSGSSDGIVNNGELPTVSSGNPNDRLGIYMPGNPSTTTSADGYDDNDYIGEDDGISTSSSTSNVEDNAVMPMVSSGNPNDRLGIYMPGLPPSSPSSTS